jgi:para-aminobenzoate synthetase/4-amino-4-deoxychorismate lyase
MSSLAILYDPQARQWLRFCNPVEVIEVSQPEQIPEALERLERRVEDDGLFAAGHLSYEAATAFDEALSTHPPDDFPLLRFGLFCAAEPCSPPQAGGTPASLSWQTQLDAEAFAAGVAAVREAIAGGETYQVNLTFALRAPFELDPLDYFWAHIAEEGPDCAGLLQWPGWSICSFSPELFFERQGDRLSMRPMKGTAARGRTLTEDRAQAAVLQNSAKDRAENIMILDMVRNDLGRLAPPGEVKTETICTLEKYPTVWQMTSTVSARSDASLVETFAALFPCASITGAPKPRTMSIIKELETGPRRIYTGCFGWLAPGRRARFSVAIRTLLLDHVRGEAEYGVGAGITWGSDAAGEYRECLTKAAVLAQECGPFALVETLRWTPAHGYFVLQQHLNRLLASAEYFDYPCERKSVCDDLKILAESFASSAQRVRLLLHRDGHLETTVTPLAEECKETLSLRLAGEPVAASDRFLYHKTTRRSRYEGLLARAEGADEVVLWNERGEITECCTANLVLEKHGELLTPPLESGLLPGTYRANLLQRGVIREEVLTLDDLRSSPRIYLINAVRKWRRAELSP